MYKVNRNENIAVFDCDETLVFHCPDDYPKLAKVELNYYGHPTTVAIHEEHVKLLKAYKKRGYFVRVWSNNGYKWAEQIVQKLGLTEFVDSVETKSIKYVDDKHKAGEIIGKRVYIPVVKASSW